MTNIEHDIGPSFQAELMASGLPTNGVLWMPHGVMVSDDYDRAALAQLRTLVAAHDPIKPAPGSDVTVIDKMDLYQRMTDVEYDAMLSGVAAQSKRVQDIFNRAQTFRSDAALWPLLQQMALQLYGPERAAELLAP